MSAALLCGVRKLHSALRRRSLRYAAAIARRASMRSTCITQGRYGIDVL